MAKKRKGKSKSSSYGFGTLVESRDKKTIGT